MNRLPLAILLSALPLAGCRDGSRIETFTGEAMGTSYRIKVVGPVPGDRFGIPALCRRLDRDLSTWRNDSWVAGFNRAPANEPMVMPPSVEALLPLSKTLHDRTEGRFDPTIGALIRVWGFGAWEREWTGPPTDRQVADALESCGFRHLRIDGSSVTKLHPRLMLDFSAIAKGFAVDRMAELLQADGRTDFIIEFGGDVLASGNATGTEGWTVAGAALEQPLTLRDQAIATSGLERNFRGEHGHVIDPRTGRPLSVGQAPAPVRASSCAEADALATADLVAGSDP